MTEAGESLLRGAREVLDYARGAQEGYITHIPESIDVKAIRTRMGLSLAKFANQFGFAVDAVRN
jgi:putative transcriptional regulator